jgi:hypothetical protein
MCQRKPGHKLFKFSQLRIRGATGSLSADTVLPDSRTNGSVSKVNVFNRLCVQLASGEASGLPIAYFVHLL